MSFVVIEGPNGSGKTTLIKNLSKEGIKTLSSPNGTPLAKMLRPACRGTEPWTNINNQVQFLLFSAARLDEYLNMVKGSNELVVVDRWHTSTYIYQCCLEGFTVDFLEYTIAPNEKIDLCIILDGDDDALIKRVQDERNKNVYHGVCTWTRDEEKFRQLIKLYREKMPTYLKKRCVPYEIINTTNKNEKEVLEEVKSLFKKYNL
jgi:thymidylate kinase